MADPAIAAVFLITDDVEALLPFYREVLGLRVTQYEPGHSAWCETGAVPLVVHRAQPDAAAGEFTPAAGTIVWLRPAERVPATVNRLEAAGAELLRPAAAANYLYLKDPEGRIIGLRDPA